MKIDEAKLYLEHTSKDDFNLEEWQQNNRYKAIQVVLEEIEGLKEEYMILQNASDKVEEEKDKEIERLNKDLKDACKVIERLKEDKKKAIEYIEERKNLNWYADGVFVYELLNILRGEDDE